jgi:hypothetical protein
MVLLKNRWDYDLKKIAKVIIDKKFSRVEESEYINEIWEADTTEWSIFFGAENQRTFRKLIDDEVYKILHPEEFTLVEKPIKKNEERKIQKLSLNEIGQKFPEIEEKIRKIVFDKYTDEEGYYYSALSGFRSRHKPDFQIDHKKPMSKGGLTKISNLQLLTRIENRLKSDK